MESPTDPLPPRPSLAGRLFAAVVQRRAASESLGDWRMALGVAVLLAAGPVATLLGARVLAAGARADAAALKASAEPKLAAADERAAARATLAPLLARPTLGATLEGMARILPAESHLVRAERGADGRLAIDVAAPDPDRLRAVLRRDPVTQGLRDTGQRRGDGAMIVTLEDGR